MEDTRGVVKLGMSGNEKPKMSELSKFLTEYCKLWKFIGYKLGLKDTVIDMIKGDYSTQRECFMATLQIWLEQDVGPTWNALELAITNARREEQNLEPLNEMPAQKVETEVEDKTQRENTKKLTSTSDLGVHFSSFVMTIRKVLEKCKDKLEECKELCSNLTVSNNSDVLLFSDEQLTRINNCTSFQELFMILRKHWNWKEYSILKTIIALCDSKEAKAELDKFEKLMSSYCGMKLISDQYSPDELPVNYVKLCITVDKPYKSLTLQDFDELRTFIFDHLDVQKYIALPFIKFLFSSLHLEWYIPTQAVSHIIKAVHQNQKVFTQKSVVLITIGDKNILDIQRDSSGTDTNKIEEPDKADVSQFRRVKEFHHLICQVCDKLFRNSKYLPCYHSYCEKCLEKIQAQSKIICPECGNEAMVPDGGVKNLSSNYFMDHLVRQALNYKLMTGKKPECEECDEDNRSVVFCTDCKLFLCCYCKESHKYSKSHHTHILISLAKMRSNEDLIQFNCKFPTCQEHDLELEYCCESCDKLVCNQCTGEHKDHKCDVVKKLTNKYQNKLKVITSLIEVMGEDLLKTYFRLSDVRAAIKQQGNEISKEIDTYYDRAFQKLLKQKEQVKQQVCDTILQKEQALTVQMEEVMHALKGSWYMQGLRSTVEENSDQEIVSGTQHLAYTMKRATERCKEVNTKPVESTNLKVTPTIEPLPQILTVDSLSFEVKDVDSSKFVQQGEIAVLEIITKDSKGSYYPRGGCKLTVKSEHMMNEKVCGKTVDNNDGTYMIYFVAQQIGEIKLSVFMNGCEIAESPFRIMVKAPIYHDGIACSNDGMWAVADRTKNCVRVFDSQDSLIKKFGSQGSRNGEFSYPCGVAFDDNNDLYVADSHNHRVQKFDIHGNYLFQFGDKGTAEGQLNHPVGITTHQNKIYVADRQNNRVSVFQNDGKFCAVIGQQQLSQSFDIAVNINNEVLAADWEHHCIYVFSTDGQYVNDITVYTEDGSLELKKPCSLTNDSDRSIVITDLDDHCVSIFDEFGDRICCFGSQDDETDHPHGIAVDAGGSIYVSDTINRGVHIYPAYDDRLNLTHAYFVDYSGRYKLPLDL